jgi:hypothetical protein
MAAYDLLHSLLGYECLPLWRMTNEEFLAIELTWTEVTSRRTEYRSPCLTVPLLFCLFLATGTCLPNCFPAMDYSAAICCSRDMLSEPFPSNGHIRHNIVHLKCVTWPQPSQIVLRKFRPWAEIPFRIRMLIFIIAKQDSSFSSGMKSFVLPPTVTTFPETSTCEK